MSFKSTLGVITLFLCLLLVSCDATRVVIPPEPNQGDEENLISRAKAFEYDTPYTPPPGDPALHHASGFAKNLCSAVFITGLDFDFAAESIGYFLSPYKERSHIAKREVDYKNNAVHVTLPNGTVRTAKYLGDQGCVCLPIGVDKPYFEPKKISTTLSPSATTPWPMGDMITDISAPQGVEMNRVKDAVVAAFDDPEGMTAALVITYNGKIIGERYRPGISINSALESWSMGKSLTGTLMGILIQKGVYNLDQAAPIPEWQGENDPRSRIRISDIMRMSSGLRFRAPQDPDFDPSLGYPDHLYVYTGSVNSFQYAANLPQQWSPNTIGRYRNCDPVLTNYLVRLGVEGMGEDYHSFPTEALFDKIGMRDMVLETDPYGNFLLQGYEFGSARDWARLGNLYLQDGVWNGERLLPEGYVDHVSTLAPSWKADGRPIYGGGFFWINGDQNWPVPKDAYFMAGAGGQFTIIIPSHDLVVVRLGHYKGGGPGADALREALRILVDAVPSL